MTVPTVKGIAPSARKQSNYTPMPQRSQKPADPFQTARSLRRGADASEPAEGGNSKQKESGNADVKDETAVKRANKDELAEAFDADGDTYAAIPLSLNEASAAKSATAADKQVTAINEEGETCTSAGHTSRIWVSNAR